MHDGSSDRGHLRILYLSQTLPLTQSLSGIINLLLSDLTRKSQPVHTTQSSPDGSVVIRVQSRVTDDLTSAPLPVTKPWSPTTGL
jgi:hypothetical protein